MLIAPMHHISIFCFILGPLVHLLLSFRLLLGKFRGRKVSLRMYRRRLRRTLNIIGHDGGYLHAGRHQAVWLALRDYVAALVDGHAETFTPADFARHLDTAGCDPNDAAELTKFARNCFNSSYAPGAPQEIDLPGLRELVERVLSKCEPVLKDRRSKISVFKSPIFTCIMLLILVVGFCIAVATSARKRTVVINDEVVFVLESANAYISSADNAHAWRTAAAQCEKLRAITGASSGELTFNMATCLFMAGAYEDAWAAVVTAEQVLGRPWNVRRNALLIADRLGPERTASPVRSSNPVLNDRFRKRPSWYRPTAA